MRGLWRMLLAVAAVIAVGVACGDDPAESGGVEEPSTTSADSAEEPASADARRDAIEAGTMPDLTGATSLNELGDQTGVLYDLRDVIGVQETIHLPSEEADEGVVIAQDPAPGTPLADITEWSLTVSEGGPVVAFDELPADVATFASTLDGLDDQSLFVEKTTDHGTVYKHDRWLIGMDCDAVDAAYRTFSDGRYDTACPGFVGAPPDGWE